MIIGGAQENTLLTCKDLIRNYRDDVVLITGTQTGVEGALLDSVGDVRVEYVDSLVRAISPLCDYRAYVGIKKLLREIKPDVVHTHSAKAGILGRLAARACGVPAIVHSIHGAPFWDEQNPITRWFYQQCERYAEKTCDAFICVADAMTDLMVNAGVAPREKFTTIYSGMEVETFTESAKFRDETRRQLGFSADDIVVGKAARLFNLKGHEFVIEAAADVLRECPKVKFMFVGDGTLTKQHRENIERRGLSNNFVFTGLVQPNEIPKYIAATDIMVHTSLREGLARVLPQALLSGKPVISYDVDGAREVVIPNETGFLLPPKTIKPLSEAIIKLATNKTLREQLANNGKERFKKQFDHNYMTDETRKVYEKIEMFKRGTAANKKC
jgi:glycosyltransferase involved in cell wall biosynthesis